MANDSTTGGPLLPTGQQPLEGKALLDFIQGWIVGITGLPGNMVRPAWQTEPPSIPQDGNVWMAVRITKRNFDLFPYVDFDHTYNTRVYRLIRHEEFHLLCTAYDLGINGNADNAINLLRDGVNVPQNRELLFLNGFGFGYLGNELTVPVLFKQRWQYRVDLELCIRRRVERQYPVTTVLEGVGTIYSDRAPPEPWDSKYHRSRT